MIDTEYTKIYSGNFFIVKRIIAELESIGISPVVKDETESGRLAGFGSSIQNFQEVYVNDEQLNEAVRIIDKVKAEVER
jgi:hypothetical protein